MQKEFTENLGKLYQCVSKPMTDLVELNISTLNNVAKNLGSFDEITQSKKPEDFIATQMKLANVVGSEMAKYSQKALNISLNAVSEVGNIWAEIFRQVTPRSDKPVQGNKARE
jgi:hypothetical protein